MSVDARVARWVDVVAELLSSPGDGFPQDVLAAELAATFDVTEMTWNWRDADGSFGQILYCSVTDRITPDHYDLWRSSGALERHPLIQWFSRVGDPAAQTIDRVPLSIASAGDRAFITEMLRPFEVDYQMSVPYELDGLHHRAFVFGRSGEDFSDEDVAVARRLQPLLRALGRQCSALAGDSLHARVHARAIGLSGRELAVLRLLADGSSAYQIGRRLAISPRTVHKHLEHVYRKLGVTDRLTAVRVATESGIVGTAETGWEPSGTWLPGQRSAQDAEHPEP